MNTAGHTILFQVALDRMTPQARAGISDLLTEHTTNPEEGGFKTPAQDGYLPTQAGYPDQWKDYTRQNKPLHLNSEGNLHYDNHPIGPEAASHPDKAGIGGVSQFEHQKQIAEDKTADGDLRANATRWVVHEYGDIGAQPLHVVEYYSQQFPSGDLAGNKFNLNWQSSGQWDTNLHSLMDGGGAHADPSDPTKGVDNYQELVLPLDAAGTSFVQQKAKDIEAKFPIALDDPRVQDQNPNDWAKELSSEASTQIYPLFTPGENLAPSDPRLGKIENLMDGNVSLAASRLAAWANSTFATGAAAAQGVPGIATLAPGLASALTPA